MITVRPKRMPSSRIFSQSFALKSMIFSPMVVVIMISESDQKKMKKKSNLLVISAFLK